MAEIKINISNLQNAISQLNGMRARWATNNTTPPGTIGGGKTVNELEELARVYADLNSSMVALASDTAAFFTNVKNSYEESDRKAASAIAGKK